jgi:antitoxin component of RelBE/YafQ-DinJ toxin-antitoxin module
MGTKSKAHTVDKYTAHWSTAPNATRLSAQGGRENQLHLAAITRVAMENSPIIRFRINREIAERAYRMAAENGLELPDVMRMMLTKAVRIGDFCIDQERIASAGTVAAQPLEPYEPRYWAEAKASLDAETALAVLHQAIAERTSLLDEGLSLTVPDLARLEQIRNERDEAGAMLAAFDPKDAASVAKILQRFSPTALPGSASEPSA